MNDFWRMGGYALYVWGSYAITVVVLLFGLVKPWLAHRQTLAKLQAKRRGEQP